jgi:hypothetical protein
MLANRLATVLSMISPLWVAWCKIVEGFTLQRLQLRFTNTRSGAHDFNHDGKGREDQSNLRHGADPPSQMGSPRFRITSAFRKAEGQRNTQAHLDNLTQLFASSDHLLLHYKDLDTKPRRIVPP